eukprot:RCo008576
MDAMEGSLEDTEGSAQAYHLCRRCRAMFRNFEMDGTTQYAPRLLEILGDLCPACTLSTAASPQDPAPAKPRTAPLPSPAYTVYLGVRPGQHPKPPLAGVNSAWSMDAFSELPDGGRKLRSSARPWGLAMPGVVGRSNPKLPKLPRQAVPMAETGTRRPGPSAGRMLGSDADVCFGRPGSPPKSPATIFSAHPDPCDEQTRDLLPLWRRARRMTAAPAFPADPTLGDSAGGAAFSEWEAEDELASFLPSSSLSAASHRRPASRCSEAAGARARTPQ